ncbi:transglycosylase SLT domain-containing protein [Bosea psychrotolerans]|uniref:Transglycosylase-like protein with SLT domain n=1 Tax=Bosea psychrotolerans TaxID=1871628 RepID=A0A2S4MQB6_9HYPH|nr:transglycosylase SLT domain-containing protein [Bosea psychrotolerans]POR56960.1 transglycosylase-like protein with SLT domain [Bosea psychrotolerans]
MRYTTSAAAIFAICLVGFQPARAESVNDEKDALAFIVRDAEIAREKAAAQGGHEAVKTDKASQARLARSGKTAPALAAPAGSEGLKALVARHAAANGVPFALADAVVRIESRYNPRATHAGNYGLMQIRHQTARGLGYTGGAGGLLDAETNARFAMKYLAQAYRLAGGDTCKTVMKYQSGHMTERMSGANRTYCAKVRTITAHS